MSGRRSHEANTLQQLGIVLRARGRFEEARACFDRSAAAARATGDRWVEVRAVGHLGTIAEDRGHLASALDLFERHAALAREVGDRQGEATAVANQAVVLTSLGRLVQARPAVSRAMSRYRDIGDGLGEAWCLEHLGCIEAEEDRPDEAESAYLAAISYYDRFGCAGEAAMSRTAFAAWLVNTDRLDAARPLLCAAVEGARATGLAAAETTALAHLASLPGAGWAAAEAALARSRDRMALVEAMDARFAIYRAGGPREHLVEAKRLLDELVAYAPPDCRASMLANVRLHREVERAAERDLPVAPRPRRRG
jgi:tetratricopeptide (TPR) repeat protein